MSLRTRLRLLLGLLLRWLRGTELLDVV